MDRKHSNKFIIFQTFAIIVPSFVLSFQFFEKFDVLTFFLAVLSILTIYSNRTIRCIYLLSIPQIFTKRGRHAFLVFAYVRLIHGPIKNISNNREIVIVNMKCLKNVVMETIEDIKSSINDSYEFFVRMIDRLVPNFKKINDGINESIETLMKVTNEISYTIERAYEWLADVMNLCSKNQTPYDHCMKTFETRRAECLDDDDDSNFLCKLDTFKPVCAFMKIFDVACDDVREAIINPMMKSIESESESSSGAFAIFQSIFYYQEFILEIF